jgi:hypothetical protein
MSVLTSEQRQQFLDKGYVTIKGCFTPEDAKSYIDEAWVRLGYSPTDSSTWDKPRIHMPAIKSFAAADFAPKAWAAACEICGGEDRIASWSWNDAMIVTLTEGADEPWSPPDQTYGKWHKDGDFFRHFLDSPEQGLLALVIWKDIDHQGSATYAATDSVPVVAKFMAQHPEGVLPKEFNTKELMSQCHEFLECVGECGDVVLLHPYMLHSGSQNILREPRFLTNPPLFLKEPMNFNRDNKEDYSLIELAVLQALGVDRLDFKPTAPRESIVPDRVIRQRAMLEEEQKRLAAVGVS